MGPEEGKEKRFSVGIFISVIILVGALAAFGYFIYLFIGQNKAARAQWQAGYEARVTPLPTSMVTEEATPTPAPTAAPAETPAGAQTEEKTTPEPEEPLELITADEIQSEYACMIRNSDGEVIVDKKADKKIYPASMSKIMTAIVALENLDNLSTPVTVYPEDIDPNFLAEASMAGFEPYEEVPVIDLLYGIMLPSGAEACEAVATTVSKTTEEFIELMNKKAEELGLKGTHFTNVSGLHDEDHYTTCHDMALLMQYAMKNDTFRQIAGKSEYTCSSTAQHPEGLYLASTVFAGMPQTSFPNGAVFEGGKTGTTDEAGKCLVSAAAFYGEEYYLVTANAPADSLGSFEDAAAIYSRIPRQ